jgi:Uncharacterized protein conserved in archaea (DUF2180)
MNCYECERTARPGGTRLGIREAVGVCRDCGVGLCPEHGKRMDGQAFLCSSCARARVEQAAAKPAPFMTLVTLT